MKKILMIMLLTFTTMANADEGRYSMISSDSDSIWVLDTEKGKVKMCWITGPNTVTGRLLCKEWKDLDDADY